MSQSLSDLEDLSFTLRDRKGEPVQYVVSPHLGSSGLKVVDAMLAVGMGPLAEAVFSAARAAESQRAESAALQKTEQEVSFSKILEHVDLDHIVTSAQTGIQSMGGMTKLAPLVLQHTTRAGKKLVGRGGNTAEFDLAYTRNWREFRDAFQRVMEINGFFDLLAGWFDETE